MWVYQFLHIELILNNKLCRCFTYDEFYTYEFILTLSKMLSYESIFDKVSINS